MSALPLLSELAGRGVHIRVDGHNLAVSQAKLTNSLITKIQDNKTALIAGLEKLRRIAGSDWEEIAGDPKQLKVFAELLMIEDMRQKGICPHHYTATTTCKYCGPVPIWDGCPPEVHGCPWCFNRIKRLPIPKVIFDE